MSLTGALAVTGKPALLATQIWAEKVNAEGGLLGRKVELVYYDDQSNPALVPSIYSKMLDVDKVDLAIPGYSTNMTAPFMPTAIARNLLVVSYFCLALNDLFHYPRYFSMVPFGPQPKISLSKGFFDIAAAQQPKPQTVAVVSADAEFAQGAAEGARENLKAHGFKIVYDRTYPPNLLDFSSVIRAVQAAILSGRRRRPGARRQRVAAKDQAVRRQHGRHAVDPAAHAARAAAQRPRVSRFLGTRAEADVPRHRGIPRNLSGPRRRLGRRSARLLRAA
jgi:hypothetical protein